MTSLSSMYWKTKGGTVGFAGMSNIQFWLNQRLTRTQRAQNSKSTSDMASYSASSSSTTLRSHLTLAHLDVYLRMCEHKGWTDRLKAAGGSKTTSNEVIVQHKRPEYSKEALLNALIAFIVTDDQVCRHDDFKYAIEMLFLVYQCHRLS